MSEFESTYDLHDRLKADLPMGVAQAVRSIVSSSMDIQHLLDVGTGSGTAAAAIGPLFRNVTLVDRDPNMLERASRRLRRIHGQVATFSGDAAFFDQDNDMPPVSVAAFCRSLNMLNAERVLNAIARNATDDAAVIVMDDTSWWNLAEPWSHELRGLLVQYVGEAALPAISEQEARLEMSPFNRRIQSSVIPVSHRLHPRDVLNLTFAASYSSRARLGVDATAFEQELLRTLAHHTNSQGLLLATNPYKMVMGYRQ